MAISFGIRREDKHRFEARVPLTPANVRGLIRDQGLQVFVQPSDIRVFQEAEYLEAGATISEDLSGCNVVFGVKEIPPAVFQAGKSYVFFSHVIKGQPPNMPMLRRLLEQKCTLIDYEKVADDKGRRLIFFGRHAGLAGMIDTLWALGQRLEWEGKDTPLASLQQAWKYPTLEAAKEAIRGVGARIRLEGLPEELAPMTLGFAGYGNVSQGAQEIADCLEPEWVEPAELEELWRQGRASSKTFYKTVFKEEDMVRPLLEGAPFELQDYYQHPEKYQSVFEGYLPFLRVLVNGIYWEERYPRLITRDYLAKADAAGKLRLKVLGDIGCDLEGAIEVTVKPTDPGNPVYVVDVQTGEVNDGVAGRGPVVLAVDTLPCELPREASEYFSTALAPYVPAIARADYTVPFEELELPAEIKRAVIVYRGEFMPGYEYILDHLEDFERQRS